MNFNFKDVVKLASKGVKPSDIAELSALDEKKFDKDDILSSTGILLRKKPATMRRDGE